MTPDQISEACQRYFNSMGDRLIKMNGTIQQANFIQADELVAGSFSEVCKDEDIPSFHVEASDHKLYFKHNGTRILVAEPYNLNLNDGSRKKPEQHGKPTGAPLRAA